MSDEPIIEVTDVHRDYDRGVVNALNGLSLSVRAGEFVAITGPSGSGKSTLLHIIATLERPTSGTVRVAGRDIARVDVNRYRRSEIGLVFQFHDLLPNLTACQNVEIAMFGTAVRHRQRVERSRELLRRVGLDDGQDRTPPRLSGGERQRVAIARALANDPQVLLADEPTGSLDRDNVARVLDLLEGLRAERGITIVMVTHDPTVAARADRSVVLADGRIVDG